MLASDPPRMGLREASPARRTTRAVLSVDGSFAGPASRRDAWLDRHITHQVYTSMESAFGIIAEPNRRAILSLLVSSERSVSEIEHKLRMPQPSVSKHLRVLRNAGFVEARVDAQRRIYRIRPEPLMELEVWLAPFRRFWSARVDALERHLDRMEQVPPRKRRKR